MTSLILIYSTILSSSKIFWRVHEYKCLILLVHNLKICLTYSMTAIMPQLKGVSNI